MNAQTLSYRLPVEGSTEGTFHDLGASDRFGRRIGTYVTTFEVDYTVERLSPKSGRWYVAPGHYFALNVQATRNGDAYGASQSDRLFATVEERDAAIEKYLRAARKAAAKKAA